MSDNTDVERYQVDLYQDGHPTHWGVYPPLGGDGEASLERAWANACSQGGLRAPSHVRISEMRDGMWDVVFKGTDYDLATYLGHAVTSRALAPAEYDDDDELVEATAEDMDGCIEDFGDVREDMSVETVEAAVHAGVAMLQYATQLRQKLINEGALE